MRDPTEEYEEDQFPEQVEPPLKKAKTHYDSVQDWVWSKGGHLLFLQETHLNEKKMQEALQYFVVRGWKALGVAATDTGRGGTAGGFLCLHPPHHHVHGLQHFIKEGNGWMGVGYQREALRIAIIRLYRYTSALERPCSLKSTPKS